MKRRTLALIGCLPLCLGMLAASANGAAPPDNPGEQMLSEQKHFVECLSCIYSPAWWFSYNGALYFQPRDMAQVKQLEAMKAARSKYLVLTNPATRHELTARLMAQSGISESWQKKLLLPLSATNQNLTPTLDKPVFVLPRYTILQSTSGGDALIQVDTATYFVMDIGRGVNHASGTNALLIEVGSKSYAAGHRFKTVRAFANVALSKEETDVLNRVSAACQQEAGALGQKLAALKDGREFEECRARANDSSPYMEYLLAKAYLDGKGTEKNEPLGLDWMNRAARNGSGDAKTYLEARGRKPQ